jgi:hypothetical protein
MIELVAVTDAQALPPEPLWAVRRGRLSLLCGPAAVGSEPSVDDLWRHEALLERLLEDRDLLPVRFGTVVADDEAAARVLAERHDELAAALERVRGAVEVAVRVRARDPAPVPAPAEGLSGHEYLAAKAGPARTASVVHETLAEHARESVVQTSDELLRAAYLVERGGVEAFVAAVQRLQQAHDDVAVLCTGPWPPFSFVTGGGAS